MRRPFLSQTYRQRSWEFFIFGFVFVALFLFWLVIGVGTLICYLTGALAGFCFTAAWFSWRLPIRPAARVEIYETESISPPEPVVESAPVVALSSSDLTQDRLEAAAHNQSTLVLQSTDLGSESEINAYCVKCHQT
jgi:hypothetical protein